MCIFWGSQFPCILLDQYFEALKFYSSFCCILSAYWCILRGKISLLMHFTGGNQHFDDFFRGKSAFYREKYAFWCILQRKISILSILQGKTSTLLLFTGENWHFAALYWGKWAFCCILLRKISILMPFAGENQYFYRGKSAFWYILQRTNRHFDASYRGKFFLLFTFLDLGGKVDFWPPQIDFLTSQSHKPYTAKCANWDPIWMRPDRFPTSKCMRECFWTRILTPQTHIWPSWT